MAVLTITEIVEEYGFSPRYWTRKAASGTLPGACQPSGPKGHWAVEKAPFEAWWWQRQVELQRRAQACQIFTGGAASIGAGCNVRVANTAAASKQEIERLLSDVLGNGSKISTRSPGATSRGGCFSKRQRSLSPST